MKTHWFPLIRPAISALFLGGVALGGVLYLRLPWSFLKKKGVAFAEELGGLEVWIIRIWGKFGVDDMKITPLQ